MGSLAALLKFAVSPLGRVLLTGALMFSLGAASGWRAHSKIADLATMRALTKGYEQVIGKLRDQVAAANDTARADKARALEAEELRKQAVERADEVVANIPVVDCGCGVDGSELRKLWPPGAGRSRAAKPNR